MQFPWLPAVAAFSIGMACTPLLRVLAVWLPQSLFAEDTGAPTPSIAANWRAQIRIGAVGIGLAAGFAAVSAMAGLRPALFAWMLFAATSILLAKVDYDSQLLPDCVTLPLLWAGLLVNINGCFTALPFAVLGAVLGYGVLWAGYVYFRFVRSREVLSHGDFKYMAAIGAWVGAQRLSLVLVLAAVALVLLRSVAARRRAADGMIAFGPALSIAGLVVLTATLLYPSVFVATPTLATLVFFN